VLSFSQRANVVLNPVRDKLSHAVNESEGVVVSLKKIERLNETRFPTPLESRSFASAVWRH
jgi:hypothetical protein